MGRKTVASILGAIVLGALGSALWDLVKPLLGWAANAVLSVSTLGLDSLRNSIYADAARLYPTDARLLALVDTVRDNAGQSSGSKIIA